jgi:hypothetical protein
MIRHVGIAKKLKDGLDVAMMSRNALLKNVKIRKLMIKLLTETTLKKIMTL